MDQDGRKERRWTSRRWVRRTGLGAGIALLLFLLAGVVAYASVELPPQPPLAETSVVLDANGDELARLSNGEDRSLVSLDEVADIMELAVIAAEDRDFYRHSGLDPRGITRAFWNDVRGGRIQGGSTITQQLVKNSWLDPERSVTRKAKEAVLAVKVEREYSKDEILERYLNTVYFGRGAYGVQTAAQAYFGVDAADLELPQAALLAGLIRAPELADPMEQPDEAERRRAVVLDAMVSTGVIDEAEAEEAKAGGLDAVEHEEKAIVAAPGTEHFVEYVRRWAVERYGEDVAYGGGLVIRTTLDIRLQDAAQKAVREVLNEPDDPAAALVSIDEDGAIKAMVGGRDFAESNVNYALGAEGGGSGRQAGSTFKPLVLAAAFQARISPHERYPAPAQMTLDADGQEWPVSNYDDNGYGSMDLYDATAKSVNTVYAQLMLDVGAPRAAEFAEGLGIRSDLPEVPSLVLGTAAVAPIDMASAFMTFGRRGERIDPWAVVEVRNADGEVIFDAEPERRRVMDEELADLVNDVLRGVVERGTGRSAQLPVQAAGKTGTTQDYGDAWFVGYTPKIGAAVWMGYPEGQSRPMESVHGRRVTGGSFPAEIWQRFMEAAVDGVDTGEFQPPPDDLLRRSTATTQRRATPPSTSAPSTQPPTSTTTASSTTSSTTAEGDPATTTSAPADTTTTTAPRNADQTTTTTAPAPTTTAAFEQEAGGVDPEG